jgi:hypothetical protein
MMFGTFVLDQSENFDLNSEIATLAQGPTLKSAGAG